MITATTGALLQDSLEKVAHLLLLSIHPVSSLVCDSRDKMNSKVTSYNQPPDLFHTVCKYMLFKKKHFCLKKKKLPNDSTQFWKTQLCQGLSYTTLQKYIAQKCIVDVWVVHMIETKPTLMTHTVLPKMRFLMTFIQINNTVYNLLG